MHYAANSQFDKAEILDDGQLKLTGAIFLNGDVNGTNASAIDVGTGTTYLTSAGAETRTLADGKENQVKRLVCITYVGNIVVTPTNLVGTTITFTAAGGAWEGVFKKGEWITLSASPASCTVA